MIHVYKIPPPELEIESYDAFAEANGASHASASAYKAYINAVKAEHKAAWWAWYKKYRDSPIWKRKRLAVLKRAKVSPGMYRCEACGGNFPAYQIEVHHTDYALVGREPLWGLRCVCDECHELLTDWGRE